MTLAEFRAWLDGFKEAIGNTPTGEQWAKVVEKLALVQETVRYSPDLSPYRRPQQGTAHPLLPYGPVWTSDCTAPLDAAATHLIFANVEALYEN